MSATIFGNTTGGIPSASFRARRDDTAKWSASLTLTIKRGDYSSIAGKLQKDEPITELYPDVDVYFSSMVVTDHEYIEKPGGLDEVVVNFSGAFIEGEAPDDRDKVYEYVIDLIEKPINEHPKFSEVYPPNQELLVAFLKDQVRLMQGSEVKFIDNFTGQVLRDYETFSDADTKFKDLIVKKGIKTYNQITGEYTETVTDVTGFESKIENIGKIDIPPKSPVAPDGMVWFMSGAGETVSGDAPVTYYRKWTTIQDNAENQFLYGV